MSDFLVLGLVPGTPIQITFGLWIVGVSLASVGLIVYLVKRAHLVRNWLITACVILTLRHTAATSN